MPMSAREIKSVKSFKALRRYLTLIELMIVMALILMISGVVGISAVKSRQRQKFQSSADQVMDKLRLAQDFMLMLKTDVRIKLTKTAKGYHSHVDVDKALPDSLKRVMHLDSDIDGLPLIVFVDDQNVKHTGTIDLRFMSGGSSMSRGILYLYPSAENASSIGSGSPRQIVLPGYPRPIGGSKEDLKALQMAKQESSEGNVYPLEILEDWAIKKNNRESEKGKKKQDAKGKKKKSTLT